MRVLKSGLQLACAVVLAAALAGCSSHSPSRSAKLDPFAGVGSPYYKGKGKIPFGGGRYHVGKPYQVAGRWFTPKEQPNYDKSGVASWYGEAFHRRRTSNGEWFDMNTLTAAHATLPLPSYAKVTNLENGQSIIVRINDRGPFVDTRIIDLSKASANALGYLRKGKTNVRVQYIGPAPLRDGGTHLAMMNRTLEDGGSMRTLVAQARNGDADAVQVAAARPARKRAPEPDVQDEPQVAWEQPDAAPAEPPPAAPARHNAYIIRVASFASLDNAQAAANSLANLGQVEVLAQGGEDDPVYGVQMGPFASAIGAQDALNAVRDEGFADARLSRVQPDQMALR